MRPFRESLGPLVPQGPPARLERAEPKDRPAIRGHQAPTAWMAPRGQRVSREQEAQTACKARRANPEPMAHLGSRAWKVYLDRKEYRARPERTERLASMERRARWGRPD